MKEIKVSDHSKLHHIVGEQITIANAEKLCTSKVRCLILTIVDNCWYQLICLSDEKKVIVYEQHESSYLFHRTWKDNTLNEFVNSILSIYPNTEFYLIEGMQDICTILKERMPQWIPSEHQNV